MIYIAEEIRNIIKNYSNESLNEIENYSDKLKVFDMIDGLINIPIERKMNLDLYGIFLKID